MSDATTTSGPQATYELEYELDGSSYAVRENLVDILERELLGPISGPEELLPFSPRSQYLVGHIAPVKLDGGVVGSAANDDQFDRGDLVEVRADADGSAEGRGVPAYAADETESDAEEDDTTLLTPR